VQVLACAFTIAAQDEEVLAHLDRQVPHAVQHYPVSRRHRLEVRRSPDSWHVEEDGRLVRPATDARDAADALFWRMYDVSLDAMGDHTRVHAGCAGLAGRRLVAVGPAHSGKSTLMTRLLYDGFDVHCDDIVLVRRGEAVPYPRRFRVRPAALDLLPAVAAIAPTLPVDRDCVALDPVEQGFRWEIAPGPADVVVFIQPAHGGPARVEPCPRHEMARRVMAQSNLPAGGVRDWMADVGALVDGASCHVLHSGNLDSSVAALAAILEGRNPVTMAR
jgi:hypothetical protein